MLFVHCVHSSFSLDLLAGYIDCVYMQEHNCVMNVSNEDWIHVNRFIRSASPNGSSQDRISKVDRIAGLEPVICYMYIYFVIWLNRS